MIIKKYILEMQCTYCHNKIIQNFFVCPNHEQVISCIGCQDYDCHICKSQFSKRKMQFCVGCKEHKDSKKMFGDQYNSFCYVCCLQKYRNCNGKKVVLCNHIFQVDKYDVYCFLKKFCFMCRKNLSIERNEDLQSGLKQIYPLENNICKKCSNGYPFHKTSEVSSSRVTQTSSQHHQSRVIQTPSTSYLNEDISPPQTPTFVSSMYQSLRKSKNSSPKPATLQQKWKQKLQTRHLRCMNCDFMLVNKNEDIITQDILICEYCAKKSNLEEVYINQQTLKNSRQKQDDIVKKQEKIYQKIINQQLHPKMNQRNNDYYYDPYKDKQNKKVQKKQQIPKIDRKIENKQFIQQQKPKVIYNNIPLKKFDSQNILERIPLQINDINDCELMQCQNCQMQVEPQAIIWEQNSDRSLCRCCFNEILDQINESIHRYQRPYQTIQPKQNINQSPVQKYTQTKITNQLDKNSNKLSPQRSKIQKQSSPSRNTTNKLQTQPQIKQDEQQKIFNKVKRTQSWNDEIIIQPVEDHEKRKREKFIQQNKIVQQTHQEDIRSYQQINKTKLNANNSNGKNKQTKAQIIQPQIIQDKQQSTNKSSRVDYSWDEKIILEPVRSQQKFNNNKKYSQQQNQPIIQQQQETKKKIKKLASWDQQIILQPVNSQKKHFQRTVEQKKYQSQYKREFQKQKIQQAKQLTTNNNLNNKSPLKNNTSTLKQQPTNKKVEPTYQKNVQKNTLDKNIKYEQNRETKNYQRQTQRETNKQQGYTKFQKQYNDIKQRIQNSFKNPHSPHNQQTFQIPARDLERSRRQAYDRYIREQNKKQNFRQSNAPYRHPQNSTYLHHEDSHLHQQNLYDTHYQHPQDFGYQTHHHPPPSYFAHSHYPYQDQRYMPVRRAHNNQFDRNRLERTQRKICSFCRGYYNLNLLKNWRIGQQNVCEPCFIEFQKMRRF